MHSWSMTPQDIVKSFRFLFAYSLPYNFKTPFNFLVTIIAMAFSMISLILSFIATVSFLIGSCWLFISFMKDLTNDLGFLNVGGSKTNESRRKMKQRFCKIIQDYLSVKELSRHSRKKVAIHFRLILFLFQICRWVKLDLWV